jgi:predicted GNAT superfamily acetyltransferase
MEPAKHQIRDCVEADYASMLRLNLESEHFLSPLSLSGLRALSAQAWYCRALGDAGDARGFLLVLREGSAYDSVNFQWFAARYSQFLYIDRIVVDARARGQRVAMRLYEDLFARARAAGRARVTCEFDIDPPNEASKRFHAAFGFREVGSQRIAAGKKTVSLQELIL